MTVVQGRMPATVAGRVPPHDLDSEAATLSAILLDRRALIRVKDLLVRPHFYSDANGLIYDCAVEIESEGQPVDIVTVATRLRNRERLNQIGGAAYLAQLADATPAVAHVRAHAEAIFEKWRLRQFIAECQVAAAQGYGDTGPLQAFLDEHVAIMRRIASSCAQPSRARRISDVSEAIEQDYHRVQSGEGLAGIPTRFRTVDAKIAGMHDGELIIVAARPGMGKTALACQIAVNAASPPDSNEALFAPRVEYASVVFSQEMDRKQLLVRMACSEAGVNLLRYRLGYLEQHEWGDLFKATSLLGHLPIWIDDTPAMTVAQIEARLDEIEHEWCRPGTPPRNGHAGEPERRIGPVIVDYLQLCRSSRPDAPIEEQISEISRDLKALAKRKGVPVIALSQLNRAVETRPGKDKRPQLSDLRNSGAIEQDADVVIFIYREGYYRPDCEHPHHAEIIIAKQRNGPAGKKALVGFRASSTTFYNLRAGEIDDQADDEAA